MNLTDILKKANPYLSAASNVGSLFSGLVGSIGQIGAMFSPDYWKAATGSGLTTAQQQQNEWNAEQSALSFARERDFAREQLQTQMAYNTQMSNTSYQRQVNDMQLAGLNPMLALGAGGSSVPAVTTNGASSSPAHGSVGSPLGLGDLLQLQIVPAQLEQMRAQSEKLRADAAKTREDTRGSQLQNDYFEEVRELRKEGEQLSNDLSKAQWKSVWKSIDVMQSQITKNIEDARSEQEKQRLYIQQAIFAGEQAENIVKMRPFLQRVASAQAGKDEALARVAVVDEAYRQGLIDNGAIAAAVRLDNASAGEKEISAKVKEFEQAIRDGSLRKAADAAGDWRSATLAGLYEALNNASKALQGKY